MRSIVAGLALALLAAPGLAADQDPSAQSKGFFNGKNLDGWEGLNQYWSVKEGAIVGASGERIPFNTFLCSKKAYGDFELSFQVRLKDGKGNSGLQIRSKVVNKERYVVHGPQCDIGAGYWGSLYGEGVGGMWKAAPKEAQSKIKPNDFNDYSIKVVGKRVTIKVNGVTTVDQDFPKMADEGIIAWQLHSGPPMEVTFRNIVFKDLSKK